MGCLIVFSPVFCLIGYYYGISWLYYIAGAIVSLQSVMALINGTLGCFGSIFTVAFWYSAYQYTGSLGDGLILGSSLSVITICFYYIVERIVISVIKHFII